MATLTAPSPSVSLAVQPRRRLLVGLGLAALVFFCFQPILHNGYLAEDFYQSQTLSDPDWLKDAFYPGFGTYRPVTYLLLAVGDFWWGDEPFPYHVILLWLHLLNTALVYALARRLTRRWQLGLAAAALFATFPPSVQAVNWMGAGHNQIPAALGCLLAWRVVLSLENPGTHRHFYLALGIVALLFGLGANEMALTWPAAALILAAAQRVLDAQRAGLRPALRGLTRAWLSALLRQIGPLLAAWLLFVLVRTVMVGGLGGYSTALHLRAGFFLFNDAVVYAWFFVAPWFELLRSLDPNLSLIAWLVDHRLVALVLVAGALWLARPALWTLLLTLVLVAPALNIPEFHRAYFVGPGIALMAASVLARWQTWLSNRPRSWLRPAALWVAVALALLVQVRALTQRNTQYLAAGRWAQQVMASTDALVPAPADGTTFYYLDLPALHGDIYVFTWGLREAVQKHYHNHTLDAYQVYVQPTATRVANRIEQTPAAALAPAEFPQVYLVYQLDPQGQPRLTQVSRDDFAVLLGLPAP